MNREKHKSFVWKIDFVNRETILCYLAFSTNLESFCCQGNYIFTST